MTDKEKIREEVERLKRWNNNVRDSTRHMTLQEEDFNRGKHSSYLEILNFIDSLQGEPVSEELEEAALFHYPKMSRISEPHDIIPADNESHYIGDANGDNRKAFKAGAQWQKENLWKSADGEDLPEIGREVVAFQEIFPTNVDVPSLFKIVVAHRPNPEGYDGKSIATGEVEHYTPKTYGKGGWNIPDVRFWLDCSMPKEIEL